MGYTAPVLKLYTFAISHFSEKARWALDFAGIPFHDVRLLPGPHMFTTRRLARRTSVPILVDGEHTIQGSSAIIDHIQDKLGGRTLAPPAERRVRTAELEAMANHAFGFGIQCIGYDALLPHRELVAKLWVHDGPRWGHAFYALTFPLVKQRVQKLYKIRPDEVERAKQRFSSAMDRFDNELGRSPYLGGDAPDRLDITVAALLAPLACPPEHLMQWPPYPPELDAFATQFAARPTTRHVLRMYREHRNRG